MTRIRDPGLQPERTVLAWNRTALSMAGNALLVIRAGLQSGVNSMLIAGILIGVFAAGLAAAGSARRRELAETSVAAPSPVLVGMTTAAVLFAAVCAVWTFTV